MKKVVAFLSELNQHNDRAWFEANKTQYREALDEFNAFAERFIEGVALFDSGVKGLTLKQTTYRIYRDIRFSPNKIPYKTHMGVYVCAGGKKSGNAGYYAHIEPGCSLLAVGLHCPEPKIVKSVREDIFAMFADFEKIIKKADGFEVDFSASLQRVPRDFPSDAPSGNYLKLKEFDLIAPLSDKQVLADSFLDNILAQLSKTKPFNDFLNRAIEFARNEM